MANRIERDPSRGWIAGTFAGLCRYLGFSPFWCRAIFLVYLMLEPVTATLAYLVATLLMPKRRCRYC
ncbi:PspC domain-containing protein [Ferrimonas sediminicola]|uniref:PspC domain-containing protein n=1 Tax=Ferrimonas sediminicola TaxID=2569538 RepID=A0A4U1BKR4_9GAMM|nr:PspC domain-containing protein [Ferrimonas sediminicola]TKB51404.1 PspC domain-containing protein [Ferrimonas sediminicola]